MKENRKIKTTYLQKWIGYVKKAVNADKTERNQGGVDPSTDQEYMSLAEGFPKNPFLFHDSDSIERNVHYGCQYIGYSKVHNEIKSWNMQSVVP